MVRKFYFYVLMNEESVSRQVCTCLGSPPAIYVLALCLLGVTAVQF